MPKPDDWSDQLRTNFLNGISRLLEFLMKIQGMDEIKRHYIEHQLMESEWETAFNIFIRMAETLSMIISWTNIDVWFNGYLSIYFFQSRVHLEAIRLCLKEMKKYTSHMPEFSSRNVIDINGFSASCIDYDVSKNILSIHQPVWRFIAGLFTAPSDILSNYVIDESGGKIPRITEIPSPVSSLVTPVNLKG